MNMRFVKGMMIGGLVSAGVVLMYKETMGMNKKKMIRKGRQLVKKMGMM